MCVEGSVVRSSQGDREKRKQKGKTDCCRSCRFDSSVPPSAQPSKKRLGSARAKFVFFTLLRKTKKKRKGDGVCQCVPTFVEKILDGNESYWYNKRRGRRTHALCSTRARPNHRTLLREEYEDIFLLHYPLSFAHTHDQTTTAQSRDKEERLQQERQRN